ncbi:sensor histidine kinase [Plantactinospora soyae]|uniref:histidine kinase n=1 Tax=Plantactinospora soyae TaxID=1544732 RepID=A0A927R4X2_9ACTN|nr:sensor histidine kinase [Plantactinospora soyae]MBE1485386.1 signal transduction histidine kinase [Plantactinospora soyae]
MQVRTALEALTMRPGRFLRSVWPWRSAAYLVGGALVGCVTLGPAALLVLEGPTPSALLAGLAVALLVLVGGVGLAGLERRRLRLVDRDPIDDPHRRFDGRNWRQRLVVRLREDVTRREIGYAVISSTLLGWMDAVILLCVVWAPVTFLLGPVREPGRAGWQQFTVAVTGAALLACAPYPLTAWAGARAAMARAILGPRATDDLGERLVEVTRSRARLVDAFEIERRRIERDLHDGAQQRLVALTMQLGLARLEVAPDSPVDEPLAKAHDLAKQALTELRELIRGVHPQVLTGRGLAAAVQDVAGRSPVPVDVDIRLARRLPTSIEVTAYFVVVEALANVAKHSGATRAAVTASLVDGRLVLRIRDDGVGGADPAAGTGLAGLVDRVAAVDGTVALSSPAGGPTVLQVEFADDPRGEWSVRDGSVLGGAVREGLPSTAGG